MRNGPPNKINAGGNRRAQMLAQKMQLKHRTSPAVEQHDLFDHHALFVIAQTLRAIQAPFGAVFWWLERVISRLNYEQKSRRA
jgi:hypothetical protein